MEKLITVEQLCELLQVKKSCIYKWTHYGFIPHYKLGTLIRFKESEIEKWLEKRRCKGRETRRIDIDTIL